MHTLCAIQLCRHGEGKAPCLLLQTLSDRPPGDVRRHPAPGTSGAGSAPLGDAGAARRIAGSLPEPLAIVALPGLGAAEAS